MAAQYASRSDSSSISEHHVNSSHTVPFSIKIICSLFMWLPILLPFFSIWSYPRITIAYNILVSIYIILSQTLLYATCFITFIKQKKIMNGFLKSREWASDKKKFGEKRTIESANSIPDILHIIIIPVFQEDPSVLENTLASLACQNVSMIIGLALEEREINSDLKYNGVIEKFQYQCFNIVKTIHPGDLRNEVRGKASNCDFCARTLFKLYEENKLNLKRPYEHIMITVCDCDTIWSNEYFLYLNYLCSQNNVKYFDHTVYVPNVTNFKGFRSSHMLSNWVSAARMIGTHGHFYLLGSVRSFVSEYHIPFKLLKRIDYWDGDLVHEDVHMRNKLAILDDKLLVIKQTFLPCDNQTPTDKNSLIRTFQLLWTQTSRWNLFVYDIYYLFYEILLNISGISRYENFRTSLWKLTIQLFINYENFFFYFLCAFSNNLLWLLYVDVLETIYYEEIVNYLLFRIQPCFIVMQMILPVVLAASNWEIIDENCSGNLNRWKKRSVFLLGLTILPFYYFFQQALNLILAWIETLSSNVAHSESAPKHVAKSS
jgi:hypothetical protein